MAISKKRLTYNISIIIIALIVATFTYPSTISMFAIVIATIGVFVTLDRIIKVKSNKTLSRSVIGICAVAAFVLVFYFTYTA
ncbi:hypothetical protein EV207_17310 [Scopulibacillus darangshiensis]|uniref:DUF3953 domain-containing protein n=1 Tax=Scopulibacillus darangshiensis TaxID=442528 RepID=A0A4R2NAC2_9BACL|nr:hypothetical protein [Scopulibacillus darangshiensis]TCP18031.1 hypothetical protein EV207_17310 [Scopulibacillus darangshiensis]